MESIFLSIKEHLVNKLNSITPPLYIDKNCGQLESVNENFPCCLIDIKRVKYEHPSDGIQQADAKVSICVADLKPQDNDSFSIFGLIENVDKALQELNSVDFGRLYRTKLKKKFANGTYEYYEMFYNINFVINDKTYGICDMQDFIISKDEPKLNYGSDSN